MKRKIVFALFLVISTLSFTSCEKTCKFCKTVTYDDGVEINSTSPSEFCGAKLAAKEATPDIVVGKLVTKVESY
jgi:hypothetical protein